MSSNKNSFQKKLYKDVSRIYNKNGYKHEFYVSIYTHIYTSQQIHR